MKKSSATLFVCAIMTSSVVFAKEIQTFKVLGNCGMCESRIEKAAKEAGAIKADWNDDSKMLTVEFKPKKTNLETIQKKIAEAGHDNSNFKATDEVYENLPGCCKYDRSGKPSSGEHH